MADSVKAIAADAEREPIVGERVAFRLLGHPSMKRGVEDGQLRDRAEDRGDGPDPGELCGVVIGGERLEPCYLLLDRRRDRGRLVEVAPVHDAVAHSVDRAQRIDHARLALGERRQQRTHGLRPVAILPRQLAGDAPGCGARAQHAVVVGLRPVDRRLPCRLRRLLRESVAAQNIEVPLEAARTGIEHQDSHGRAGSRAVWGPAATSASTSSF